MLLLWSWCPAVSLQPETVTERLFWHFYWLVSCLYLPPRSHSSTAVNRLFSSLQSHTNAKIHLRCESQRNVWAVITLHICGSFFQSSWEFQQSWAISNKFVFSPQMTPGKCHKVARSGPVLLFCRPEVYKNLMHFLKNKNIWHIFILLILLKYRHCECVGKTKTFALQNFQDLSVQEQKTGKGQRYVSNTSVPNGYSFRLDVPHNVGLVLNTEHSIDINLHALTHLGVYWYFNTACYLCQTAPQGFCKKVKFAYQVLPFIKNYI